MPSDPPQPSDIPPLGIEPGRMYDLGEPVARTYLDLGDAAPPRAGTPTHSTEIVEVPALTETPEAPAANPPLDLTATFVPLLRAMEKELQGLGEGSSNLDRGAALLAAAFLAKRLASALENLPP